MVRELFLLRHAKSDWSDSSLKDFDRPLNSRGMRDAPRMGALMKSMGIKPDLVVSSTANRAKNTTLLVTEQIGVPAKNIVFTDEVYEASVRTLLGIINNVEDLKDSLMIIGHNPTMTFLAEYLTKENLGNMPTASFAKIHFDNLKWAEISEATGSLVAFEYPKKHFGS